MSGEGEIVGRVAELWRYPVQSLRGEALETAAIGRHGVVGDRAFGLVDPAIDEFVTSARGQRRWRDLVTYAARLLPDGGVEIRLADGLVLTSAMPDIDERLSAAIGRPVRLRRKGEAKPVYKHSDLHVLTTASLVSLGHAYPAGRFAPARFRPNIVIDTGDRRGFPEQGWLERGLRLGEVAAARVGDHTTRCVMTTLAQGDLPQDPAILQVVREQNAARCGVYAAVTTPGVVKRGDPVRLVD
jgi:uncharacterized protein YcbX